MDAESTTSREEIVSEKSYNEGYQKALRDVLSDIKNLRPLSTIKDVESVVKNRIKQL